MKKIILTIIFCLLSSQLFATDRYIDPEAGDGGDGTFGTPWNEWSDLSGSTGDDIYFKAGTIYTLGDQEMMCPPWGGTTENKVIIGTYWGNGVFTGSDATRAIISGGTDSGVWSGGVEDWEPNNLGSFESMFRNFNASNVVREHLTFQNLRLECSGALGITIRGDSAHTEDVLIDNIYFYRMSGGAYAFQGDVDGYTAQNCVIYQATYCNIVHYFDSGDYPATSSCQSPAVTVRAETSGSRWFVGFPTNGLITTTDFLDCGREWINIYHPGTNSSDGLTVSMCRFSGYWMDNYGINICAIREGHGPFDLIHNLFMIDGDPYESGFHCIQFGDKDGEYTSVAGGTTADICNVNIIDNEIVGFAGASAGEAIRFSGEAYAYWSSYPTRYENILIAYNKGIDNDNFISVEGNSYIDIVNPTVVVSDNIVWITGDCDGTWDCAHYKNIRAGDTTEIDNIVFNRNLYNEYPQIRNSHSDTTGANCTFCRGTGDPGYAAGYVSQTLDMPAIEGVINLRALEGAALDGSEFDLGGDSDAIDAAADSSPNEYGSTGTWDSLTTGVTNDIGGNITDVTAPTLSGFSPSATQTCDTDPQTVRVYVYSDETCNVRVDTTDQGDYDSMPADSMDSTDGTTHYVDVLIACGGSQTYYFYGEDPFGNESDMLSGTVTIASGTHPPAPNLQGVVRGCDLTGISIGNAQ